MCGIAGIVSADPSRIQHQTLDVMARSLRHRGPDGLSTWLNPTGIAGLSHSRLAIVDLGAAAAQPMHFADRFTIVFNGEIYNYRELRESLTAKGYAFRSQSDTEVILAMYQEHGEECVSFFDGMFAFAIWDEQQQQLFCARDRFGEKPFFYSWDEHDAVFVFGSEMKALYAAGIQRIVDHTMMLRFLVHGATADPLRPFATFDSAICQLPPSHCCTLHLRTRTLNTRRYWDLDVEKSAAVTDDRAVETFTSLFEQSVKRRLHSAVPVGVSLSGGLDSSSVAAIFMENHRQPALSFTASFPGYEKDELALAQQVAAQCGFANFTVAPSASELWNDLDALMYHQEEPFSSSSVYAQYRVYKLAKEHGVTVLLDGQGADETLAGYDRYRNWKIRSLMPGLTASLLERKARRKLEHSSFIHADYRHAWSADAEVYKPPVRTLNDLLYHDVFQSGLAELLRYADRNSMAHGREVRLPFLHHELVRFVFSLPANYKLRGKWSKWILRESMAGCLPASIVWQRKKIAFEPPQKSWMKYPAGAEAIGDAYAQLVKERILPGWMARKPVAGHDAYENGAVEWRCLMAAMYLRR